MILPIIIIGTMTTFVGFLTPSEYSSTMMLVIEETFASDRLLEGLVAPTDASSRLNVIKETIASDSFAERLVAKLKESGTLGPKTDWKNIEASVRRRATVDLVTRSLRPKANDLILRITFTMNDQKTAPIVLQAIAEGFIEESARPQKEAARTANDFIRRQIQDYETELHDIESQLQDYKVNNYDALPGAYDKHIEHLIMLQRQLVDLAISEQELQAKRQDILTQLVKKNPDILRIKSELAQAASRYTEHHPLVQSLREQLQKLESRLAAEQQEYRETGELDLSKLIKVQDEQYNRLLEIYGQQTALAVDEKPAAEAGKPASGSTSDALVDMVLADVGELQQVERQLKMLKARQKAIQEAVHQQTVVAVAIPAKEQLYADLTRRYEALQTRYMKAYQRLQDAKLSEELDYIDSLKRFKILQKPHPEGTPIQAPKIKLLLMGLIMALVSGLGLAFMIEFFDARIYSTKQFAQAFRIPVLGRITNQFKRSQVDE